MNNITKFLMSVAAVSSLSGCIGQSESSCPVLKKKVCCVWGPRAIMEATNNHDDLKYLKKGR
uniref:Lipoprotein n=1 Tax=Klebsiella pneumoniae TaxID=573 RepID=A0A8B0SRZ2_KLEPN|nr:hypothetical protein [Klebsiella pneumoniae]